MVKLNQMGKKEVLSNCIAGIEDLAEGPSTLQQRLSLLTFPGLYILWGSLILHLLLPSFLRGPGLIL